MFCELPDGTIGGFPSWIADSAKASDVTMGTPLASAAALAELCALLGRLHSDLKRDKASLKPVLQEQPFHGVNHIDANTIDDVYFWEIQFFYDARLSRHGPRLASNDEGDARPDEVCSRWY
jgi:hypothetical protein